ncbi:hypothetical protein KQX54_018961 [Cotesia glomerata]|uniref:Uncharacterized protein n=1 Tax=Cotesia glomerata TaxID=32391 RepID=A0AAV7I2M3_COTGL|nr:hypothetical protein KQX54_018961 [Cotesia glomerata]
MNIGEKLDGIEPGIVGAYKIPRQVAPVVILRYIGVYLGEEILWNLIWTQRKPILSADDYETGALGNSSRKLLMMFFW